MKVKSKSTYPCFSACPGAVFVARFNKDFVDNLRYFGCACVLVELVCWQNQRNDIHTKPNIEKQHTETEKETLPEIRFKRKRKKNTLSCVLLCACDCSRFLPAL